MSNPLSTTVTVYFLNSHIDVSNHVDENCNATRNGFIDGAEFVASRMKNNLISVTPNSDDVSLIQLAMSLSNPVSLAQMGGKNLFVVNPDVTDKNQFLSNWTNPTTEVQVVFYALFFDSNANLRKELLREERKSAQGADDFLS